MLALTAAGGLGTTYYLEQRSARAAALERLVGEARTLRDLALTEPESVSRWEAVLAALGPAEAAEGVGGDAEALRRINVLRQEAHASADAARRDRTLLDAVAEICAGKEQFAAAVIDAAYTRVFRDAGVDVDAQPPASAGRC